MSDYVLCLIYFEKLPPYDQTHTTNLSISILIIIFYSFSFSLSLCFCLFPVDLTNGQLTPNNNTPLLTQALSGEVMIGIYEFIIYFWLNHKKKFQRQSIRIREGSHRLPISNPNSF